MTLETQFVDNNVDNNIDAQITILARETLYRFLASALCDPRSPMFRLVLGADNQSTAVMAADLLREDAMLETIPLGFGELLADALDMSAVVAEFRRPLDDLLTEYDRTFGLIFTPECPPYETEYLPNSEPFFRAQQMADVAGFYRAFGLDVASAQPERPDHITLELEFMALLLTKERIALTSDSSLAEEHAELCRNSQRKFFSEHLAWWVPSFASGLRRKAGDGPYAAVARALTAFLPVERSRYGVKAPQLPVRPHSVERPEEQSDCASCSSSA